MSDETLISEAQDNTAPSEDNPSTESPAEEVVEAQADAEATETEGEAEGQTEEKSEEAEGDAVPEEYEAFNLPEGVEIDTAALEQATPLFKDMNLSQEQSQQLVDLFANITQERSEALAEQAASIRSEWQEGIKTHPEFGGAKVDASLATSRKPIDAVFGDVVEPEAGASEAQVKAFLEHPNTQFRQLLTDTGIGDHPLFFEFMVKVGKSFSEGSFVNGNTPPAAPQSHAEILYSETQS